MTTSSIPSAFNFSFTACQPFAHTASSIAGQSLEGMLRMRLSHSSLTSTPISSVSRGMLRMVRGATPGDWVRVGRRCAAARALAITRSPTVIPEPCAPISLDSPSSIISSPEEDESASITRGLPSIPEGPRGNGWGPAPLLPTPYWVIGSPSSAGGLGLCVRTRLASRG
nr:MAG: hypothetical protein [Trichoderma harzianum orthocurvulavirus 1]